MSWKKLCRLKFWKKSLLQCHFFHFLTKKHIKSLFLLPQQKISRRKFWKKSVLSKQYKDFMLVIIQNKQKWQGRNDFYQNLSLRNFCLYRQESDFTSFFVQKWKKWQGKSDFFSKFEPTQFFSRQNSNLEKKNCCTLL